jgi:hypothetical protein
MLSTKEIYNIEPETFQDLPYREALQVKLAAAKERCHHFVHIEHNWLNNSHFDAAYKAVKHNQHLIDELNKG